MWSTSCSDLPLLAAHRVPHRLPSLLRFEDHQIPGALEDLPDQPVGGPVRQLDHNRAVGELLDHRALLAEPASPLGRDPHPGHPRASHLSLDEPFLLGEPVLGSLARLEGMPRHPRLLHPIEPEVTRVLPAKVIAAEVPTLRAADELVGLDLALCELVLVLLVVVQL